MSAQFQLFFEQQKQIDLVASRIKEQLISQSNYLQPKLSRQNLSNNSNEFFKKSFYEFKQYNKLVKQKPFNSKHFSIEKEPEKIQIHQNDTFYHQLQKLQFFEILEQITTKKLYINKNPNHFNFEYKNQEVLLIFLNITENTFFQQQAIINHDGFLEIMNLSFDQYVSKKKLRADCIFLLVIKMEDEIIYYCLLYKQMIQSIEKSFANFLNQNVQKSCYPCQLHNKLILVYDLNNNSTWNIEAHTLALIHATQCSQPKNNFLFNEGGNYSLQNAKQSDIGEFHPLENAQQHIYYNICLGKNKFNEQMNDYSDDNLIEVLKFIRPEKQEDLSRINLLTQKKLNYLRPKSTVEKTLSLEKFNGIQKQQNQILKSYQLKKITVKTKNFQIRPQKAVFGIAGIQARFYENN